MYIMFVCVRHSDGSGQVIHDDDDDIDEVLDSAPLQPPAPLATPCPAPPCPAPQLRLPSVLLCHDDDVDQCDFC